MIKKQLFEMKAFTDGLNEDFEEGFLRFLYC